MTLVNLGTTPKFSMGHNWVLLAVGADVQTVPRGRGRSRRPPTTCPAAQRTDILAATKLLGPDERDTVTFTAPDHAGPLRVPLFIPRALPGRHAWRADRRVTGHPTRILSCRHASRLSLPAASLAALLAAAGCNPPGRTKSRSPMTSAAAKSYVAPGEKDEFYLFYSGGHSGQVYVAGLPSMRHITTIPVFAPYPATGYGFDEESKQMLGGFTWGDVHHPGLSQTDGDYDGRWLFVNDNANNRVARIDLRDFKTKQILGPIPNSSGNHGSSFVTENSEYVLVATRFSVPLPKGRYADPSDYETEFNGMVSGIKVDPKTGEMAVGWQILEDLPPDRHVAGLRIDLTIPLTMPLNSVL